MVNIGVLTGTGEMYLIHAPNVMGSEPSEEIEALIASIIELGVGNFNWQTLNTNAEPTDCDTLDFRFITTLKRAVEE